MAPLDILADSAGRLKLWDFTEGNFRMSNTVVAFELLCGKCLERLTLGRLVVFLRDLERLNALNEEVLGRLFTTMRLDDASFSPVDFEYCNRGCTFSFFVHLKLPIGCLEVLGCWFIKCLRELHVVLPDTGVSIEEHDFDSGVFAKTLLLVVSDVEPWA